ncbi:meckelin isoform X2 [Bactrocera tryoni]|uniref:meckelin isoform X2 n=1 Tax=Bactrocera tryoni TaxID=59916 RepID=UPI001A95A7B2|nr:meckelin isoform X2 [Bactrocera tryoni]
MWVFVKQCFLCVNVFFQVLAVFASGHGNAQTTLLLANSSHTTYSFHQISECKYNEFYDLDTFSCVACGKEDENLQSTPDKFSCECAANYVTIALYDTQQQNPLCAEKCSDILTTDKDCQVVTANTSRTHCELKLVNFTDPINDFALRSVASTRPIRLTPAVIHANGICNICDLKYNYRYLDYCIANAVLKPYLKYNSFWQSTSANAVHFGDLKFVVFFCLALRNNTACSQLANLCIMSHYSADKNSPCSAFLLTQVSDVAIKYASMDEHLQATKPSLFYKKGKETAKMLTEPLGVSPKQLQLFSTAYHLDGSLRRWGAFKMSHVNLCQMHAQSDAADWKPQQEIQFARFSKPIRCELTVENLIDLAKIYANNNFLSLFLNISREMSPDVKRVSLQALPILIEDITPENLRAPAAEWQLVKRFQLIAAQPRHGRLHDQQSKYEDDFKLSLYRSIRYVESFEMYYEIHDRNQIGIPLVKLRYRHVDLSANATLNAVHPFKLQITFERIGEATQRKFIFEVMLPAFLFIALTMAMLQMLNYRKRHNTLTTTIAATTECCAPSSCLLEFLVHFSSYAANAALLCFVLYILVYPVQFLTQRSVAITLPIIKDDQRSLEILIYAAVLLKLIFICVHFWRISHFDLFLIDWERPRSCEANHFTLKNNLETSSMCSSVRTFATENISSWRIIFIANEWIRLSAKQKHSAAWQGLLVLPLVQVFLTARWIHQDLALQLFFIVTISLLIYIIQLLLCSFVFNRIFGDPLQKFIDLCSLSNISVFMLLEQSFGFYIHGRSPNGFADTDMYSMLAQMHRNSQHRCSRKGLLGDSDQQSYIILPPLNLRIYFEKLLAPYQRSYSISQAHFQKEINTIDAAMERSSATFNNLNRFLCAFIDHAIKDMDYIIKEKTFIEKFLNCECDNYLTENKGTFYIDNAKSFDQLLLYGNSLNIFIMELALLLALYMLTNNLITAVAIVYILNKLLQHIYINWLRQNVTTKTSIDQRFLM